MSLKKSMLWLTATLILSVLAASALLLPGAIQNLFYYPKRGSNGYTPESAGLPYEDVYFSSADGTRLHGWFIPAVGETKGVVLHVHGNTGNISSSLPVIAWLPGKNYAVFTFDYRGYGFSDDKSPTPKGLMEDTQSAIAYLQRRNDIDTRKLLIFAQSLGGNNAVAAVAEGRKEGIAGIALDATFYSYKAIANDRFPGAGLLFSDRYSACQLIQNLAPIPLLFLHGDNDPVIPWQHSQKLFEAAEPPKQFHTVPGGGHLSSWDDPALRAELLKFFEGSE
jgi:fermentation-respiration switch protein FrsA (DUF1100 family)